MNAFKRLPIIAAIYLCGCATVTRGTQEKVSIISEPSGASAISNIRSKKQLTFDDGTQSEYIGCAPTPCSMKFSRKGQATVTVSKPGHDPIKFVIVSTWEKGSSALAAGSIVAGIPPGSYAIAGKSDLIKRIGVNGGVLASGIFYGIGPVVDFASGANRSLSPNPISVYLAPIETAPAPDEAGDKE